LAPGFLEIHFVDFKPDKLADFQLPGSFGGMTNSKEGIHHGEVFGSASVEEHAFAGKFDREGRRMGAIFSSGCDCLVGDVLVVAATALVFAFRMKPARNVTFVGVGNTDSEPIDGGFSGFRKVKYEFVAVVEKTF